MLFLHIFMAWRWESTIFMTNDFPSHNPFYTIGFRVNGNKLLLFYYFSKLKKTVLWHCQQILSLAFLFLFFSSGKLGIAPTANSLHYFSKSISCSLLWKLNSVTEKCVTDEPGLNSRSECWKRNHERTKSQGYLLVTFESVWKISN